MQSQGASSQDDASEDDTMTKETIKESQEVDNPARGWTICPWYCCSCQSCFNNIPYLEIVLTSYFCYIAGRMVLPFTPLTLVFENIQYYVDTPPVTATKFSSFTLKWWVYETFCRFSFILAISLGTPRTRIHRKKTPTFIWYDGRF